MEISIPTVMEEFRERNPSPNSANVDDEIVFDLLRDACVSPPEVKRRARLLFTPTQTGILGIGALMTVVVLGVLAALVISA